MATVAKPTNEHIAEMLAAILRELEELRKEQAQLAADVRKAVGK